MSDPKVEGPNSDPVSSVNVDALLAEVKQMADRVENLIGTGKPSKPVSDASAPNQTQPTSAAPKAVDTKISDSLTEMDSPSPSSAGESSESTDLLENLPKNDTETASAIAEPESNTDLSVDQNTEKIAEEEINNVLDRLESKKKDDEEENIKKLQEAMVIESMPKPAKMFLVMLMGIDRLFLWVPRPIKDILGLIGISTLLLAMLLWIMIFMLGS